MILFSRSLIRTDFTKSPQEAAAAEQQQFSNFKDRELKSRGQKSFFWQKCLYEVGRRA